MAYPRASLQLPDWEFSACYVKYVVDNTMQKNFPRKSRQVVSPVYIFVNFFRTPPPRDSCFHILKWSLVHWGTIYHKSNHGIFHDNFDSQMPDYFKSCTCEINNAGLVTWRSVNCKGCYWNCKKKGRVVTKNCQAWGFMTICIIWKVRWWHTYGELCMVGPQYCTNKATPALMGNVMWKGEPQNWASYLLVTNGHISARFPVFASVDQSQPWWRCCVVRSCICTFYKCFDKFGSVT